MLNPFDALQYMGFLMIASFIMLGVAWLTNQSNKPLKGTSRPSVEDYPTATPKPLLIGNRYYELRRPLLRSEQSVPMKDAIARIDALNDGTGDEDVRYVMDHQEQIPVYLVDACISMLVPGAIRTQTHWVCLEHTHQGWSRCRYSTGIPDPNRIIVGPADDYIVAQALAEPFAETAMFVLCRRKDLEESALQR